MKIPLSIETHDRDLGFEIVGRDNSLKRGTVVDAPGGFKVEYKGTLIRKALGIPEILEFVVDASMTVDLGLFSAWLYDKVKNKRVERIVINDTEVTDITEEGIRRVVQKEIKIEK